MRVCLDLFVVSFSCRLSERFRVCSFVWVSWSCFIQRLSLPLRLKLKFVRWSNPFTVILCPTPIMPRIRSELFTIPFCILFSMPQVQYCATLIVASVFVGTCRLSLVHITVFVCRFLFSCYAFYFLLSWFSFFHILHALLPPPFDISSVSLLGWFGLGLSSTHYPCHHYLAFSCIAIQIIVIARILCVCPVSVLLEYYCVQ